MNIMCKCLDVLMLLKFVRFFRVSRFLPCISHCNHDNRVFDINLLLFYINIYCHIYCFNMPTIAVLTKNDFKTLGTVITLWIKKRC